MSNDRRILGLGLAAIAAASALADFTYQGQLQQNGVPFSGTANVVFRVFDAAAAGTQLGTQALAVPVSRGLFTVDLGTGGEFDSAFNGSSRWMELVVNGTVLTPRQPLTPAPYALFSQATRGVTVPG